jgi:phosphohistidine phosphatase
MKTLLILRHAKSSWNEAGLADHDRPLNRRGKQDAPRMGELLRREGLLPDLIVSSTAARARSTAEIVAQHCGYDSEIRLARELYAAGPEAWLEALAALPDDFRCVLLVGHNPDLEELLETLTGEYVRLPTAALAQVSLPLARWRGLNEVGQARLVNVWRPKELPA